MECNTTVHPFQKDPGTSQHQRAMDELSAGSVKIDGRTLADLLEYFARLSRHINYFDAQLKIKDWQPFFRKSLPFILVSIIKYDDVQVNAKIAHYNQLFDQNPGKDSLRLLLNYISTEVIRPVSVWNSQIAASGLPVELQLNQLIKDKLSAPLKAFIIRINAAVKWYHIEPVRFNDFMSDEAWDLEMTDLYANFSNAAFVAKGNTKQERLIALRDEALLVAAPFINTIRKIAATAELSMEQSLFPLKEELKEKHTPHLALLFSFLKLFTYLQDDLNSYTKKHLDFFYTQVIGLRPKAAVSDYAHLVFEIQNQLDQYLLKKGLLVKDGKDVNKVPVLFSLDEELVVNKAQIASARTLFLNQKVHGEQVYLEGVYVAPDASKADGVDQPFKDPDPLSWPTLGAKNSKYTDPENKFIKPYPGARMGFILASPVLLLSEGTREVKITLSCKLNTAYCGEQQPPLWDAAALYNQVKAVLGQEFYYINRNMIAAAVKLGISKELNSKLDQLLVIYHIKAEGDRQHQTDLLDNRICNSGIAELLYERTVPATDFEVWLTAGELTLLAPVFKRRRALNVTFSGEKEWIIPAQTPELTFSTLAGSAFTFTIKTQLLPAQAAVTFYDASVLLEDFNTTMPVVKIELDDHLKLLQTLPADQQNSICIPTPGPKEQQVSLYHFFRNITLSGDQQTKIEVSVCGLKNIIVQNEESLQQATGPVYPFGTRPDVIDFDLKAPLGAPFVTDANLVGPDFYIGSKEVFGKKWKDIYINLNWKDKPDSFRDYYKGYLTDGGLYGLDQDKFLVNLSILQDGKWNPEKKHGSPLTTDVKIKGIAYNNRKLFNHDGPSLSCVQPNTFAQTIRLNKDYFNIQPQFRLNSHTVTRYNIDSFDGFVKLNLQIQDFGHKVYSYVLARQMMAFGRYPTLVDGAIYIDGGVPAVFDMSIFFGDFGPKIIEIANNVLNSAINGILNELIQIINDKIDSGVNVVLLNSITQRCKDLLSNIAATSALTIPGLFGGAFDVGTLSPGDRAQINGVVRDFVSDLFALLNTNLAGIEDKLKEVISGKFKSILDTIDTNGIITGLFGGKEVVIPNEPWTPVIKNMALDYTAWADSSDIDLIHLYPYPNTYKKELLNLQPSLFPTFCEEGTLFLGIKGLVPGENLQVLFQLAEATADSEAERVEPVWSYLENNTWKSLRKGFELLDDDTDGLTTSGIIKFALPANMTSNNTILPAGLHWIKAAVAKNSSTVSETMGIFTQAAKATFVNAEGNDQLRLAQPLPMGSIAKLEVADSSVKKISQPYDSSGGSIPEVEGHFYTRISELLRHKGRGIQKFDYERLALEAFPQLFKVKCINHSTGLDAHQCINDVIMAPGAVVLAVIPDLHQLKAAQQFEPRVPVSLLDKIAQYLKERISPFVSLRVMNPRYEQVDFCITVKLYAGKDENYYKEKLRQDLREFMAPWAVGVYDKLTFGQCLSDSDVVQFLEKLDYMDYIIDLKIQHGSSTTPISDAVETEVCPLTPRSILIAGNIDITILQEDQESWGNTKEYIPCANNTLLIQNYCND